MGLNERDEHSGAAGAVNISSDAVDTDAAKAAIQNEFSTSRLHTIFGLKHRAFNMTHIQQP